QTRAKLAKLGSPSRDARLAALRELEAFEDYGMVDAAAALAGLTEYAARALDDDEATQTRNALDRVRAIHTRRKQALAAAAAPDLGARLVGAIETVLDPLDSVRRRRRARAIMKDLVDHRISHGRAAKELRALYDRQGGGWLRDS